MVNNYSNILALLQAKIDESIDGLSDSKRSHQTIIF